MLGLCFFNNVREYFMYNTSYYVVQVDDLHHVGVPMRTGQGIPCDKFTRPYFFAHISGTLATIVNI